MSSKFRVSSAVELQSALKSAHGGDLIVLAPGEYGDVKVFSHKYSAPVIIESAISSNPATFRTINIWGSKNIQFNDVKVEYTADASTTPTTKIVNITESQNIAIKNSIIHGDDLIIDGNSSPAGRAISAIRSSGITIDGNEISDVRSGVLLDSDHVTIVNNTITDLRTSFIAGWTSDSVIDGNVFRSTVPVSLGGAGDHADVIHIWSKASEAVRNVTITDNFFSQDDGTAIWGVYIEGTATKGLGAYNVTIENNVLVNSLAEGVIVRNLHDSVISNNTLIHSGDGDGRNAPTIRLTSGSTNVTVTDNILSKEIITTLKDADLATLEIGNNIVVDRFEKLAPNYIGNAFVNPLTPIPEIADLQTLPGGFLDGLGVGAKMTRFDATPEALTALALVAPQDRGQSSFRLDAGLTANVDGFVKASDATFRWTFGDGTTALGKTVTHTYAKVGAHDVTLEVRHSNGETDTFRTVVVVPDPQLLKIGAEAGRAGDLSSHDASVSGTADVVTVAGGAKVLHFDSGDHLSVSRTDARHIFDLDGFTYKLGLQATAGKESAGELFRIHTALKVSVDSSGVLHVVFTNAQQETFTLDTTATKLLNGAWHDVTFSYDAQAERAVIEVDGGAVGEATMRGLTQPLESWGLDVGGRWSKGFTGNISALELRSLEDADSAPASLPDTAPAPTPVPPLPDQGTVPDTLFHFDFETADPGGRLIGGAAIVQEAGNGVMAFDGKGDALDLGALSALDGASEVAFAFDFKPDVLATAAARLFWVHTEYGIELLGDSIALRVGTESGKMVQLRADPGGVTAGEWNRLVVNLDEDAGTAQVHLNGALVLDRSGLALDITGPNGWTARLGGAFGNDFDGRIDNLFIDDAPIDPLTLPVGGDLLFG